MDAPNIPTPPPTINVKVLAGQDGIHGALQKADSSGTSKFLAMRIFEGTAEEQHLISLGTEFTNTGLRFYLRLLTPTTPSWEQQEACQNIHVIVMCKT